MPVNKIVTKVDGLENKTIDFNDLKAGLAAGSHTITVEAWNEATLVNSQTRNFTIASSDTTAPTILIATVENAAPDKLVVVFSEAVNITDLTGLTITGDVTPILSAQTGSGSNTITFTLSAALTNGQSVTLNVASNNSIEDAANNTLTATTKAITNNVAVAAAYDVDYQAVLDYATTNSITHPDAAQKTIDNQLVLDLKSNGFWAKADVFINYGGTAGTAFRRICWKRLLQVDIFGGLTWSADGIEGNGTNGYVDLKFQPFTHGVNWTLENAGIAANLTKGTVLTTATKAIVGAYDGVSAGYTLMASKTNQQFWHINGATFDGTPVIYNVGLNGVYRSGGLNIGIGSSTVSGAKTTEAPMLDIPLYMLARNVSGTAGSFSDERIKHLYLGASLSETEHNTLESILP